MHANTLWGGGVTSSYMFCNCLHPAQNKSETLAIDASDLKKSVVVDTANDGSEALAIGSVEEVQAYALYSTYVFGLPCDILAA